MKKNLSKVVAAEGYTVLIEVGNRSLQVTQFESVDLAEFFTPEEIEKSASVKTSFQNGWLVFYKGQKLPKKPESKINIPNMKVGKGPSSVNYKVVEKKHEGRKSDIDFEIGVTDKTKEMIKTAQDTRKQNIAKEKEELEKLRKKELETDAVIKAGKVDIPEITLVRVDGQEMPLEDFKAPKSGKRSVKETAPKVNIHQKKIKKNGKRKSVIKTGE